HDRYRTTLAADQELSRRPRLATVPQFQGSRRSPQYRSLRAIGTIPLERQRRSRSPEAERRTGGCTDVRPFTGRQAWTRYQADHRRQDQTQQREISRRKSQRHRQKIQRTMKLYAGSATEFIQLNIQNKLA